MKTILQINSSLFSKGGQSSQLADAFVAALNSSLEGQPTYPIESETFDDPDHSHDERRFITLGMSTSQRLLFVAHADSGEDRVRIISARTATRRESHAYQERSGKDR